MNKNGDSHHQRGFGAAAQQNLAGKTSWHLSRLFLSGAAFIGIAACSDATGPNREIAPRHESFPIDVEVTITDYDDGTQYTLNTAAQEIRMSDGRVLVLDSAQTADALAAFYGTIATDSVATDFATLGSYTCPEPYTPTGCYALEMDRVPDAGRKASIQLSEKVPSVSSKGNRPPILFRRARNTKKALLSHPVFPGGEADQAIVVNSRTSTGLLPTVRAGLLLGGSVPRFDYSELSYCEQIATDAVAAAFDYFNTRTSFVKDVWKTAVKVGTDELVRHAPAGTQAAVSFIDLIDLTAATKVRVGVLALYWNTYDCSNKKVLVGPFYLPGQTGGQWVCVYEPWEISFDGGATWYPITVKVCYTEAA